MTDDPRLEAEQRRPAELHGRVAIITGAARGIGRAVSRSFSAAGATIVANYVSSQAAAEELEREISRAGGQIMLTQGSVADHAYVKRLIASTLERFGRLDILVNNAGVLPRQLVMLTKPEVFQEALDINLTGSFLCAREALRPMVEQRSGAIISMASVAAYGGLPGQAAYASAKAGVIALTRTLASEVARRGIRVNAIAPGYIETDMLSAQDLAAAAEQTPMKRAGTPDEVAEVALFLASERARYITGQTLIVDGGLSL